MKELDISIGWRSFGFSRGLSNWLFDYGLGEGSLARHWFIQLLGFYVEVRVYRESA